MFYVYMIHHPEGAHYVGMALNPQRRLRQHNGEIPGGARYTLAVGPGWVLTYVSPEGYRTKSEAMSAEYAMRTKLPRKRKRRWV
jgi:putative endonuclease